MNPRILNIESNDYSEEARGILLSFADLDEIEMSWNELIGRIQDYDGLIVRLGYFINAEVLNNAQRLKVIATATTGLNHIDIRETEKRNIKVISLKGEREFLDTIHATAELTWGLILSLVRNIPNAIEHVRAGEWNRNIFRGNELHGKTLGIIGLGRLGSMVAGYGLAFGMRVVACDPYMSGNNSGIQIVALDELFAISDVVSIHVPLNETTENLISEEVLLKIRKGGYIVNTSRGEVIDGNALVAALEEKRLSGAALDVLPGEHGRPSGWLTESTLWNYSLNHSNLIITPHIGGATWDSMRNTEIFIAQRLKEFFNEQ